MAEQFARPELLVSPQWLAEHLDDPTVRIVDGRTAPLYDTAHIPGAVLVDFYALNTTDSSPEGLRAWTARMEEAFSAAGIARGRPSSSTRTARASSPRAGCGRSPTSATTADGCSTAA